MVCVFLLVALVESGMIGVRSLSLCMVCLLAVGCWLWIHCFFGAVYAALRYLYRRIVVRLVVVVFCEISLGSQP